MSLGYLIIEDEDSLRFVLGVHAELTGMAYGIELSVYTARDMEEALEIARNNDISYVLCDFDFHGHEHEYNGLDIAAKLKEINREKGINQEIDL